MTFDNNSYNNNNKSIIDHDFFPIKCWHTQTTCQIVFLFVFIFIIKIMQGVYHKVLPKYRWQLTNSIPMKDDDISHMQKKKNDKKNQSPQLCWPKIRWVNSNPKTMWKEEWNVVTQQLCLQRLTTILAVIIKMIIIEMKL